MQSINAGFQSLKTLIPHTDGEKLSKVSGELGPRQWVMHWVSCAGRRDWRLCCVCRSQGTLVEMLGGSRAGSWLGFRLCCLTVPLAFSAGGHPPADS